jgi:hypothetical protein
MLAAGVGVFHPAATSGAAVSAVAPAGMVVVAPGGRRDAKPKSPTTHSP